MNRLLRYIPLLVIPILFFITGNILKNIQGPYYLNFYDPSYVYLINALNLAQGFGVGHFDHPGTTVQLITAIIVKIYHWISNADSDIVKDVLSRPENYLRVANLVFLFISTITLFTAGIFTYKISNNLFLSFIIQLSPFVSMQIFYGVIIITPDNFLIFVSICFLTLLIYYLYNATALQSVTSLKFLLLFSVVCGIGVATKLNFIPLFIIPLILIQNRKNKILFLFFSFVAFLIFVLPAISNYSRFIEWVQRLLVFSGHYGTGSAVVIDSSSFIKNLGSIFIKDNIFFASYLITGVTLICYYFRKNKSPIKSNICQKQSRLLTAIFATINLQVILVAKQYAQYYMIPSFMLLMLALFLCASLLSKIFRFRLNTLCIIIITLVSIWSLWMIIFSYYEGNGQRFEAIKVGEYIKNNYPDATVISAFGSANSECALAFAVQYAASQTDKYNSILTDMQHSHIFYNPWIDQIYTISKSENTKNILLNSKKIILQINAYGSPDNFLDELNKLCGLNNSYYKKVFTNENMESVYEIFPGK